MNDVIPTGKAQATVRSFLARLDADDSSGSENDDAEDTKQRAPRLGLGAKYVPHLAEDATDQRLKRDIQRKRQRVEEQEKELRTKRDFDDDDEVLGSRTASLGSERLKIVDASVDMKKKKKNSKKKKKSSKTEDGQGEKETIEKKGGNERAVLADEQIHEGMSQEHRKRGGTDGSSVLKRRDDGWNDFAKEENWNRGREQDRNQGDDIPRKRRKTRSRQKNLRKDKRTAEQRPAHFSEQTLLAGRLPRHNGFHEDRNHEAETTVDDA